MDLFSRIFGDNNMNADPSDSQQLIEKHEDKLEPFSLRGAEKLTSRDIPVQTIITVSSEDISDPAGVTADAWVSNGEGSAIAELRFAVRRAVSRLTEMTTSTKYHSGHDHIWNKNDSTG